MTTREALQESVMRCRRRLQWLLFVRHACVVVPTSVAVAAAIVVALRPEAVNTTAWLLGAFVAGIAVSASVAAWYAPTPRAVAAALDRELRLEDRVVTALQFLSNGDPISDLIVRDAVDRLAGIVPSQVFSLDLHVGRRAALVPIAAAALAAAIAVIPEARRDAFTARFGGEPLGAGATRPIRAGADVKPGNEPTPEASVPASERVEAVNSVAARPEGTGSTRSASPDVESARAANRVVRASREDAADKAPSGRTPAGVAAAGENTAGAGAGRADDERGISLQSAQASGAAARSSGAAAEADMPTHGGGGVRGGSSARSLADASRSEATSEPSYPPRYGSAWARVQGSLGRNEVPASFRTYLRDYFVAIRPVERE
jgi:hypothetical protein